MFPITHIWFAEKVLKKKDSDVTLGAIFPDIVINGCLDYKQTHYCGWPLFRQLKQECPDFADAMITHTIYPKGLDYYGDESYGSGYKGYCFQKGAQIVDQVIKACNIPNHFGLWKAHNFIEMGIELNIIESMPALRETLHRAFLDDGAIKVAAGPIEKYFDLRKGCITESFKRFSEFIELEKSSCHTMAVKYNLQMQSKHNISIDVGRCSEIICCCQSIVQNDIEEFMEFCSANVKGMLEGGDQHQYE